MAGSDDAYNTILKDSSFLNRLEAYFTNQQYGRTSALWNDTDFPMIENGYCSPVESDNRRKIAKQPVTTTTTVTYKTIVAALKTTFRDDIPSSAYIKKHKVCFIQYLLSAVTPVQEAKSKLNESPILKELVRCVLLESEWDYVLEYIKSFNQEQNPLFTETEIDFVKKIPDDASVSSVLNLFRKSTEELLSNNGKLQQIDVWNTLKEKILKQLGIEDKLHPLHNLCNTGGLLKQITATQTDVKDALQTAKTLLMLIGTHECTLTNEDIIQLEKFEDLPFSSLGTFFHLVEWRSQSNTLNNIVRTGHCFSIHQVAMQLLTQFGHITLGEIQIKSNTHIHKYFETIIIPWVAFYYSRLDPNDDFFGDLLNKFTDYINKFKQYDPVNSFKLSLDSIRTNKYAIITDKYNFIKAFLSYLYMTHNEVIESQTVSAIYDKVGDVLFNLIAYLGYSFYSDDITSSAKDGFSIAEHCMQRFLKIVKKLDQIKVDKRDTADTFGSLMRKIEVKLVNNSVTLEDIIASASSICVHGIGILLLTAYLSIYKTLVKIGRNPKLAPFLTEVPLDLKSAMNGFDFITCTRVEVKPFEELSTSIGNITFSKYNPCQASFVIDVINPGNGKRQRLKLNPLLIYKQNVQEPIDIILPERNIRTPFIETEASYKESLILKEYLGNPMTYEHLLQQIARIPYLFQQDRKVGFSVYAKYCLHCCQVAGEWIVNQTNTNTKKTKRQQAKDKYDKLLNSGTLNANKPYDLIEVEEVDLNKLKTENMPKFLKSFIAYHVDSNKFVLNTDFDHNIEKLTYDLLQNIGSLEFTKGRNVNSTPTVLNINQRNITRVYYYVKLLFKVLQPETYFNYIIPTHIDIKPDIIQSIKREPIIEYWTYFERYYRAVAQELSFTTNLWDKLWSITTNNTPVLLSEYDSLLAILLKNPQHKQTYTLVSKLRNHHITKLESLYTEVQKWFDINKDKNSIDIDKYKINVKGLFDEIRIRIFNVWLSLTAVFCKDWYNQRINSLEEFANNPKVWFGYFYTLLQIVIADIYPGGSALGSYQFNFTEILRDLYFYEDLSKKLRAHTDSNVKNAITKQLIEVEKYIIEKIPYYKEDSVTRFKITTDQLLNDTKDGAISVFDHWAKATAHMFIKDNMGLKMSQFNRSYEYLRSATKQFHVSLAQRTPSREILLSVIGLQFIAGGQHSKPKSTKTKK